jgi:hypothetical protein
MIPVFRSSIPVLSATYRLIRHEMRGLPELGLLGLGAGVNRKRHSPDDKPPGLLSFPRHGGELCVHRHLGSWVSTTAVQGQQSGRHRNG